VKPLANAAPVVMSVGDPLHTPPPSWPRRSRRHADAWNRYPPMQGTPAFRSAVAAWLTRRYNLPDGYVIGERNVLPLAGTKEGLFMAASSPCPRRRRGSARRAAAQPVLCLLPGRRRHVGRRAGLSRRHG